jgi:hypothetical protein
MPPLFPVQEGIPLDFLKEVKGIWHSIKRHTGILAQAITLRPGFSAKVYTVTTAPLRVYVSAQDRVILLVNPSTSAGLTTSGTLLASGTHASSNTQASPLSVGNFMTLRLFLDITITGGATNTITINAQTRDPLSLSWATAQSDVFSAASSYAVGTYYANLGQVGIDLTFAVSWTIGAGTPTWSLSYLLKDGLPGSGAGAAQTIYLSGSDAVNSTSGFAILEGSERSFFVPRDTEIWVVSTGSVTLKILELS